MYEKFHICISQYLTLPSLAFAIFRYHFIEKDSIYQIGGIVEQFIRKSYTGGAVDMYIPKNNNFPMLTSLGGYFKGNTKEVLIINLLLFIDWYTNLIFVYDVNSLYPSQMKSMMMPTGQPTYFKGNVRKYFPDAFGFFLCKVTAPTNLDQPILQTHVDTPNGTRTMAALGTFTTVIFSTEMDNAIKFGYTF